MEERIASFEKKYEKNISALKVYTEVHILIKGIFIELSDCWCPPSITIPIFGISHFFYFNG
jgi:hypothetical protein